MAFAVLEGGVVVFKFKPIGFTRAVLAGIFYFALFYLMLRYGFNDADGAFGTALLAGLSFGFMFWFAMSMLGEGGLSMELRKNSCVTSDSRFFSLLIIEWAGGFLLLFG